MKFRTPCFVRVENVEEREALITWCTSIGYEQRYSYEEDEMIVIAGSDLIGAGPVDERVPVALSRDGFVDCNTDVELFKALAAMNKENAFMQYYVYETVGALRLHTPLGGWWLCTEQRWLDWSKPRFSNSKVFARKATAEEIIVHFKNR